MARLVTFDGLALPNGEIVDNYENIETIRKSEAGTDLGTVTRLLKLSVSMSIKCDGHTYESILKKAELTKGTLVYRGMTKTARLRLTGADFEKDSEQIEGAKGLWTIALSITEV